MPRGVKCFTPEQEKQIAAEYDAGASAITLSAKYGFCQPAILKAVRRGGGTVRGNPRRRNWTPEEDAQIRELHAQRKTFKEMESVLGRDDCVIAERATKLGLSYVPGPQRDLTGDLIGEWEVLRLDVRKGNEWYWVARCGLCRNEYSVCGSHLRSENTSKCQHCSRRDRITHGLTAGGKKTPEWVTWASMIQRCYDQNYPSFPDYGGRGIEVCDEWIEDAKAFSDYMITNFGPKPENQSIGRIDNDGNYEPGNVRWETAQQQAVNKRTTKRVTWEGRTLCYSEWDRELGFPRDTVRQRLEVLKWPEDRALTTPVVLGYNGKNEDLLSQ